MSNIAYNKAKEHLKDFTAFPTVNDIVLLMEEHAKDMAISFTEWLHNNWYEPTGTDFYWRLKVEDIEYTLPIPKVNLFLAEDLYEQFLKEQENGG